MSIQGIPTKYLNISVTWQRRSLAADSVGDVTETWTVLTSGMLVSLQPVTVKDFADLPQGQEFNADYKAYVPVTVGTIKNGDRLVDTNAIEYDIVGVEKFKASRVDVSAGHHYKLFLQSIRTAKS